MQKWIATIDDDVNSLVKKHLLVKDVVKMVMMYVVPTVARLKRSMTRNYLLINKQNRNQSIRIECERWHNNLPRTIYIIQTNEHRVTKQTVTIDKFARMLESKFWILIHSQLDKLWLRFVERIINFIC